MAPALKLLLAGLLIVALQTGAEASRQLLKDKDTIVFKGVGVQPADSSYEAFSEATIGGKTVKLEYKVLLDSSMLQGRQNPDRTSLIEKFDKLWAVTQDEDSNGAIFLSSIEQDKKDGTLTVTSVKNIPTAPIDGIIRPCSGSRTVWKSHLGTEETAPEGRTGGGTNPTPYKNGWAWELEITDASGSTSLAKRYALGRSSKEQVLVMPDRKTVYITEDVGNGGPFYLFIAAQPGNLKKGKLFAAKWEQTSDVGGGAGNVRWIPLNPNGDDVDEAEVKGTIGLVTFNDIFEYKAPEYDADNNPKPPPAGFKSINQAGTHEWLRLKTAENPNAGRLASVLETRRMACYVGATCEFSKFEGATFDDATNTLYVGMTNILAAMNDNPQKKGSRDVGGPNDIRQPANIQGAVYGLSVGPNAAIGSNYVAKTMYAEVAGSGRILSTNPTRVSDDEISNPDNVSIMSTYRTVLINEDDDGHLRNYLWAYNLDSKSLTRIYSAKEGSEVTGGYYFPNFGKKFSYILATSQHPSDRNAVVGYWTLPKDKDDSGYEQ